MWHTIQREERMPPDTSTKPRKLLQRLERRHEELARKIAALGPVLMGTITQRKITRDVPDAPGGKKEYGPYYQWTFKRDGKTVTVNLSAQQAKKYQKAIDEHRKLERLLNDLREASLQLLEATTQGVPKRTKRP